MTTETNKVAVKTDVDADNWSKTTNSEANKACPNNNPFVYIPSTLNGKTGLKTKWWTNYWWGENKWGKGTYIYGDNGQFDSNFDPKKFYEETSNGIKLKAFYDPNWKNPDDNKIYPTWITSELVSGGMDGQNDNFYGQFGEYAVIAEAKDFGDMDPQICFGIFTFQYGEAANPDRGYTCGNRKREIDLLETISFDQQQNRGNAQFAMQPANGEPHPEGTSLLRYEIPKGTSTITAYLNWGDPMGLAPTIIRLYSADRSIADIRRDPKQNLIPGAEWVLSHDGKGNGSKWYGNVPRCVHQRMHINLYVPRGNSNNKADRNKVTEVNIKRFEYHGK